MTPINAVTANLGCASPSTGLGGRPGAAESWARDVLSNAQPPDLVFAQEIPSGGEWLKIWKSAGYDAVTSQPVYKARSTLLWRESVITRRSHDWVIPTGAYHGSYVAGALLRLTGFDSPVAVLSVHASPRQVTPEEKTTWLNCGVDLPDARHGGGRYDAELFDSDMVLETLRLVVERSGERHEILAAGDFNECLAWDRDHPPETWGRDFFGGPVTDGLVQRAGLRSVLHERWGWDEQPTSFGVGLPQYQLDHVLATPSIAATINARKPYPPDVALVAAGGCSDHAPVAFTIGAR